MAANWTFITDLERNYTILHFELINLESQQLSRED
jgi:hypothetical protein